MSSYITRNLKQTATYWPPGTNDGFGGKTFGTPVIIKVRWEDRTEKIISASGDEKISRSRVYVTQDVQIGGWLLLGSSTAADPTSLSDSHEILDFRKIPDIAGKQYERRVLL